MDRLLGKAQQRLHQPMPREVVLVHDAPWEGNASAYHSIFKDVDRGLRRQTVSADDGSDKLGPDDIQRWSASLRDADLFAFQFHDGTLATK